MMFSHRDKLDQMKTVLDDLLNGFDSPSGRKLFHTETFDSIDAQNLYLCRNEKYFETGQSTKINFSGRI